MIFLTQELVPQDFLPGDFLHAIKNSDYSSVRTLSWQLWIFDTLISIVHMFLLVLSYLCRRVSVSYASEQISLMGLLSLSKHGLVSISSAYSRHVDLSFAIIELNREQQKLMLLLIDCLSSNVANRVIQKWVLSIQLVFALVLRGMIVCSFYSSHFGNSMCCLYIVQPGW